MSVDAGRLLSRVSESLRPHGWRPSGEEPVVVLPRPQTFVRHLDNGWAATLTLASFTRDEIELSPWRPGMREVVEVDSAATFPAAERLAAHLGMPPGLDFDVAPPFRSPGDQESLRQHRGEDDVDGVVAEIVAYAQEVVVPSAENAELQDWLEAYTAISRDDPEVLVRQIPVMLLAHGCETEVLVRLETVRRDPALATPELAAFADRVERLVRSGAPLPTDGSELVALAAEHERRCAAALAAIASRRDAARRELQAAMARLAAVTGGAGVQALWKRRPSNGNGV